MAILIDPPAWPAHGTLWSHLVSDARYEELHDFAARLGLPRRSFDLDHYDLPAIRYAEAVALGARPVTAKDIVHRLRDSGLRVRQAERAAVRPVRRRQYLESEWTLLGTAIGAVGSQRTADGWRTLGGELIARWNEPHRSYHDERHLEDVLLALDHLRTRGERIAPETLLAAWFHDAVYTSAGGGADELASARLATTALGGAGLSAGLAERVAGFVVATDPGHAHPAADPPAPLSQLLDADLAIFAASSARYAQYASGVRAEYVHLPATEFAVGRARILNGYLAQPAIYRSSAARQLWEPRARRNVADEIERVLGRGRDPGIIASPRE